MSKRAWLLFSVLMGLLIVKLFFEKQVGEIAERVFVNRPQRNNSPGNLRYAKQAGSIGPDSGGYAVFGSVQDGWNALYRQISLDARRGDSLWKFISEYAPSNENNTKAYFEYLAKKTGARAETPIKDIDIKVLADAIAHYEGFYA